MSVFVQEGQRVLLKSNALLLLAGNSARGKSGGDLLGPFTSPGDLLSLILSRRNVSGLIASALILANLLKLDIRPLPLVLLRLQSQTAYTDKEEVSDILSHDLCPKLTVQF